ncbi:MAG: hypothetical protein ACRESG_05035 [Gammaproteobacteria bacterium]
MKALAKTVTVMGLMLAAMLVSGPLQAAAPAVAVNRIVPAQPSQAAPDQIGVLVFFDFSAASQALLGRLAQWASGAGHRIVLDREPLIGGGNDITFARAFVVARTLGVTDSVLPGLFALAAKTPAKQTDAAATTAIANIFKPVGINGVEFAAAWSSPAAGNGIVRARALAARYQIAQARVVIVNGLWRLVPAADADASSLIAALNQQIAVVASGEAANQ